MDDAVSKYHPKSLSKKKTLKKPLPILPFEVLEIIMLLFCNIEFWRLGKLTYCNRKVCIRVSVCYRNLMRKLRYSNIKNIVYKDIDQVKAFFEWVEINQVPFEVLMHIKIFWR